MACCGLPNAPEDGVELRIGDMEGMMVALKLAVVIEEEGQQSSSLNDQTVTPKLKIVLAERVTIIDDDTPRLYRWRSTRGAGLHQMDIDERVRRARFIAKAKIRTVTDLETAITTLERTNAALTQFIAAEERRTKITNRTSAVYSMAASDSADRSKRLQKTIAELKTNLRSAIIERDSAVALCSILEVTFANKPSPPLRTFLLHN